MSGGQDCMTSPFALKEMTVGLKTWATANHEVGWENHPFILILEQGKKGLILRQAQR